MFKMTRTRFHGTRNFEGQIAHNLLISNHIKAEIKTLNNNTYNEEIKKFIKTHFYKTFDSKSLLLRPQEVFYENLKYSEKILFKNFFGLFNECESIFVSNRALINNIEYHTINYDNGFNTINCNTIQFKYKNNTHYCTIVNFFSFIDKNYVIVKKFIKKSTNNIHKNLNKLCQKHIDKFFIHVVDSDEHLVINFSSSIERVIFMQYTYEENTEIILSPCLDLTEHD